MNTRFSKTDKPRVRFAQSNINLVYKGNASETQSKPTLRSGGLQLVGKLQGTRRNPPPPPWVPSIKAEMGGQDTKVNIVPPGGSGWGTGSSTSVTENTPKGDPKSPTTTSVLKDITVSPEKDTSDSKHELATESQAALVKPPQKPFFALRSPKSVPVKPSSEDSPEIGRSLAGKSTGPTVPFYQRPTATPLSNTIPTKDSEVAETYANEKEVEAKDVPNTTTTPRTGWAAVTTEEPDFQEQINFSDDDEEEVAKASIADSSKEPPKASRVSESSWPSNSIQSQLPEQVPYPRTAWDQPCFNPVSPIQHAFNATFCGPNDGIFADSSSVSGAHTDVLPNREVALLSEQLQRTSFTTSEAQVQAQREERTLAFKSAVTRAQMARRKRNDEGMDPKRKDQSVDSPNSTLVDANVFPQSIIQSASAAVPGPPTFPIHGLVNSSQRHSVEPMIAALYNNGLSTLMHSVASSNSHLPAPMKPQPHLASTLSPSWNTGSFPANNQPTFMHPYPLSNSPKLPNNQGFYFKSDRFTMNTLNQQPSSKSGQVQGLQSDHDGTPVPPFANNIVEPSVVNHISFQTAKPHITHQPPSPVMDKGADSEPTKEMLSSSLSRAVVINNHPIQISAHPDSLRASFTPPPSSTIETFPSQSAQPQTVQSQQSHITPLMEVEISGKWNEKDFDTFPPSMPSRVNYMKSFKSGRGGAKHTNGEKISGNRYTFGSSGRLNRGPPTRDTVKRSSRRTYGTDDDRMDELATDEPEVDDLGEGQQGTSRRQRRDDIGSGTFPRQQRVRGPNRISRSNRGAPPDYDERKHQNSDFDRHQLGSSYIQRDKWKNGNKFKSSRQVDSVIEKANSVTSTGSGRGRKNFSRSGLGRRYAGTEDVSKSRATYSNQRKADENMEKASVISPNDVDNVDIKPLSDSEQGTSVLPPRGPDIQQYNSQRSHRGGGNGGRTRRGHHGGSQRQPQRRDRIDRTNTRRQNNRRHPDEDDDHDFKGAPANSNGTSTAAPASNTTTSAGDCTTGGNESRTNTESNGTTSNGQQQSAAVDATHSCGTNISASSTKFRSHTHSVTLTSDVEVWETASEGFSSSLLGASPGSFAERTNTPPVTGTTKTIERRDLTDGDDDNDDGGFGHPLKRSAQRRAMPQTTGKIVPLMSINAEAPPSYCDNPSFLDSPPPTVKSSTVDPTFSVSTSRMRNVESVTESTSSSSEDGFMEVRSRSSKKQHKAKLQQKSQKSSISSEERSSSIKTKSCDQGKSRGRSSVSPKADQKSSKLIKSDEVSTKDKQISTPTAATVPVTSSQTPPRLAEPTKKTHNFTTPPANAWLKPLQETINEKAAAAALAAQTHTKLKTSSADDTVAPSKAAVSTTVSSYAWSVVVGSRAATTTSSCSPTENLSVSIMANANEKTAPSKPVQNITADHPLTAPTAVCSQPPTIQAVLGSGAISQTRQSKVDEKLTQPDSVPQLSDPSRASVSISSSTVTTTSANVCKVRPQKQPTSAIITSSAITPVLHTSKPESTFLTVSTAYSTPGNTVLINTPQFRRPVGDVGDWLGKTSGMYTNTSSVFFDAYGSKKIESTADSSIGLNPAAAAAAMYLQQHQQPFRQTLQPLQQQQPLMGFGLPDLTMRHPNNRMSNACSQNGMGTDSYFTASPFGAGGTAQAGAQQPSRGLYPSAPPHQRGFPSWPQQHSQQEAAVMAAAVAGAVAPQAAALWSSNYTSPPPPPHHHSPYVGVIGADRPSSTSRLQPGNTGASIYGSGSMRSGNAGAPGVGGAPFAQPAPPQAASMPPSGLYSSSPTHPTPPPPLPFDPNFAYTSGGLANSTNVFSHQSGAAGGAALLAAPHRQSAPSRSIGDHPHTTHPPVFINASHAPFPATPAAISVHGLAGPPTASMTTPGLHF